MSIDQTAPDFALSDQNGQTYRLSDQLKPGGVVLVFYPYDQTPSCTKQLCEVNQDLSLFAQHGVKVFGVNNAEAESHLDFAQRQFLNLPLLSDPDYSVSKAYSSLWQIGPIKVIRRTVVGIDSAGIVRYYQRGVPSNRQILANFIGVAKTRAA